MSFFGLNSASSVFSILRPNLFVFSQFERLDIFVYMLSKKFAVKKVIVSIICKMVGLGIFCALTIIIIIIIIIIIDKYLYRANSSVVILYTKIIYSVYTVLPETM